MRVTGTSRIPVLIYTHAIMSTVNLEHYVGATRVDDKGKRVAHGHGCLVTPTKKGEFSSTILMGNFIDGKPEGEMIELYLGTTKTVVYDNGVMVNEPHDVYFWPGLKYFLPVEPGYYFGRTKDEIGAPHGIAHGEGETFHKDGTYHKGWYEQGKENGRGEIIYPNGDIFRGTFRDGKPFHGTRIVTLRGVTVCIGPYHQDDPSGPLTLRFQTGPLFQYEGEHKDFTPHGEGKAFYRDECHYRSYFGTFQNGKRHGEGSAFDKIGRKTVGVWVEDTLTHASKRPCLASHVCFIDCTDKLLYKKI